jgi:hypothetical protein
MDQDVWKKNLESSFFETLMDQDVWKKNLESSYFETLMDQDVWKKNLEFCYFEPLMDQDVWKKNLESGYFEHLMDQGVWKKNLESTCLMLISINSTAITGSQYGAKLTFLNTRSLQSDIFDFVVHPTDRSILFNIPWNRNNCMFFLFMQWCAA